MSLIRLPIPPTDNQLRIPVRGRLIKSAEYRAWEELATYTIGSGLPKEMYHPTYERQMRFNIALCLADKRRDISNFTKACKDYLTGRLWDSDKWVDLHIELPVLVVSGRYEEIVVDTTPTIYTP